MKVLALTSSTSTASVALGDESGTIQRSHSVPRGHTEFMNSAIDSLLQESGWSWSDVDLIGVDHGPGSFTGIRVAVSVARSLCYTLEKPCFQTESLAILSAPANGPTLAAVNAFKNLIFAKFHSQNETRVLSPGDLESWTKDFLPFSMVGDAWSVYQSDFTPGFLGQIKRDPSLSDHPQAATLVKMAQVSRVSDWISDWKMIVPLYLRESAAEENLRKP